MSVTPARSAGWMDQSHKDVARMVHALFLGIYQLASEQNADLNKIRAHEAAIVEMLLREQRRRTGVRLVVDNDPTRD